MSIVTVPAAGQYGVIADQVPQELPVNAWTAARNMVFRDGFAERVKGFATVFTTPSITPYFVTPYTTTTARFWVYAGTQKVFVDDGTARTEITPASTFTGTADDRWTGGSLNGVLILNNGVDQPQYWGGNTANDLATMTGWNANWKAAALRPFKNYAVALGITKTATAYPNMVKWSHAADPGTIPTSWDETDPTKDAGEQDLAETPDLLVDCLPLGDINVIYKERSMYAMQFIGQPYIWRFSRLPGEVGMLARGCAVQTPKGHVVLAAGDVVLHNGMGPQSILTGRQRKWLFNNMDSTYYKRSFVTANPKRSEVWVCFPEVGQTTCSKALVWNWDSDTIGFRDITNTTYGAFGQINYSSTDTWTSDSDSWDSDATAWNQNEYGPAESRLIMTRTTPDLVLIETGSTFAGTTITASLERTGLAFDAPEQVKTVAAVVPRVDAAAGTVISVEVGASMDAEQSPSYSPAVSYTVGTTRKADAFASGRFLAVRFSSTSTQPWRIKSFDLELIQRGRY